MVGTKISLVEEEASLTTVPTINNHRLQNGQLTGRIDTHRKLFHHYFGELFDPSTAVRTANELALEIEINCRRQYQIKNKTIKIIPITKPDIVVFEFHLIGYKPEPKISTNKFHLSIHRISNSYGGSVGLVHIVRDDKRRNNAHFHDWKNRVLMNLNIEKHDRIDCRFGPYTKGSI